MSQQFIWLGDSRDLCQKFKPETIQCVITDPPFGVDNQSNMAVTPQGKEQARKIAGDSSPVEAFNIFSQVVARLMPAMKPDSDWYVVTSWQVLGFWLTNLPQLMGDFRFEHKGILVWAKNSPGLGDLTSWGQAMEYILYFRRGSRGRSEGITRANGFFLDPTISPGKLVHPHEKPVTLLRRMIEHSTNKGDWLVDPFGGSGSLARAARECDRNAVCIELDEYNYKRAQEALDTNAGGLF